MLVIHKTQLRTYKLALGSLYSLCMCICTHAAVHVLHMAACVCVYKNTECILNSGFLRLCQCIQSDLAVYA